MSYYIIAENSVYKRLHLTLLPGFNILQEHLESFIADIKIEFSNFVPIVVEKLENKTFITKDGKEIHVVTIEKTDPIQELHNRLLNIAEKHDVVFVNSTHVGETYSPHVSGATMKTNIPVFDNLVFSVEDEKGFTIIL